MWTGQEPNSVIEMSSGGARKFDARGKQWRSEDIWHPEPIFDTFGTPLAPTGLLATGAAAPCPLATPLEISKLNVSYWLSLSAWTQILLNKNVQINLFPFPTEFCFLNSTIRLKINLLLINQYSTKVIKKTSRGLIASLHVCM